MKDISILIPSIRTTNWKTVLKTLKESCKRYSYEVVFAGPFDPPPDVDMTDVKFLKTYACPSRAGQQGAKHCHARLLYHAVDDAIFLPDAIDSAVDLYNARCTRKDVINMRYIESDNFTGSTFPENFWLAHYHAQLRLPGIPGNYRLALHFLIDYNYFVELGGFDCACEYMNFNLHDLIFRVQYDGGQVLNSVTDVTTCNHYGNRAVDHGAIEDAYIPDFAWFRSKYGNPNALRDNPVRIDYENYNQQPAVWPRRFAEKMWASYEEMIGVKATS